MNSSNPRELIFSHRYADAIEACHARMRQFPDENYYGTIGDAFLGLGQFQEAISSYTQANTIEDHRLKGHTPFTNHIGTAMWLLGHRREAIQIWYDEASGVISGRVKYGDLAGGGIQGLLLWYGTLTTKDDARQEFAVQYLQHLLARRTAAKAVCWPRPIIAMVLGESDPQTALLQGTGVSDLSSALKSAETDILHRRQLCQWLFYQACLRRIRGDEVGCIKLMEICRNLDNPILEREWYLARGECAAGR